MSKSSLQIELPLAPPRGEESLLAWLYRELRSAVLSGRLKPGARLPSSRNLAKQHGVARGTVTSVFEQLLAEGYLISRVGSGTTVSRELPDKFFHAGRPVLVRKAAGTQGHISKRGRLMTSGPVSGRLRDRGAVAFRVNQPSVDHFPLEVWSRLVSRRTRMATHAMLLDGDPMGYPPLREAVATHLGSSRGVVCSSKQVMIVSGTLQALDMVARLALDANNKVWMEDPGYAGAAATLRATGARLVPVPVDEKGLRVTEAIRRAPDARFAYVTPAHQFPLCVTMSLERRLELLEWSRATGSWIFEDDYDSEFRFSGSPLAALQGLAPDGNVIFSGSFNKMLFPSLRIGFLVLPAHLVDPMLAARSILDRYAPVLEQAALCDFIAEGHFGRHLRRMREVYSENLAVLMKSVKTEWGNHLVVRQTDTGLQTVGWLAHGLTDTVVAQAAASHGVELYPLSKSAMRWKETNGVAIGFGAVRPAELHRGVRALAPVLRQLAGEKSALPRP